MSIGVIPTIAVLFLVTQCSAQGENTCEPNWTYFNSACYFFNNNTMSHSDALNYCTSQGANLMSIHSREEQRFLESHRTNQYFWIGLVEDDEWHWTDGTPIDYTNWYTGEPNYCCPVNDRMCGGIGWNSDHRWFDYTCNGLLGFVCKKRACEPGWHYLNNACYFFNNNTMPHSHALAYCKSKGANLASIHSQEEQKFLEPHRTNQYFWIGLVKGDEWYWTDGTPIDYTNWYTGEPNYCCPANTRMCVIIGWNFDHRWNDDSCNDLLGSVCKKRIYGWK